MLTLCRSVVPGAVRGRALLVMGVLFASSMLPMSAARADWPMYRHDAARSGVTSEGLQTPLAPSWVFRALHPPQAAWGDPKREPVEGYLELRRMHFDDVFHVSVAAEGVFFGSSSDNKLYCLEPASGAVRWSRITGGPIRLSPTVVGGRVYVGSDDGHVYCFQAADGTLVWDFHAAPAEDRVLGHGRMISLWPVRTGVLVDRGVAYFGAGIFPAEGVFLYAVDAATGRELWRNETCGELPQSRISPQGYLLASAHALYVPRGRVSPAVFDRKTGRLMYETYFGKSIGGSYALLAGEHVYTGTEQMLAFQKDTRDRFAIFAGRKLVVRGDVAFVATETALMALDREKFPPASRRVYALKMQQADLERQLRGNQDPRLRDQAARVASQLAEAERQFDASKRWQVPCDCHESLILAGDVLVAGGPGKVMAFDARSGKSLWAADVQGTAKGLAVSDGRLWVSTDQGRIHCFAPPGTAHGGEVAQKPIASWGAESAEDRTLAEAAERIVEKTGVDRGYGLVVGLHSGRLAAELARRTELMIYAVDSDPQRVAAVRQALDEAGLHGARICVECWPWDGIPYSDYFANLIVSESGILRGTMPGEPEAILRMLKPVGGQFVLGSPVEAEGSAPLPEETRRRWQQAPSLAGATREDFGRWVVFTRGPIPGGGAWTHLYGNAANTGCGDDQLVRAPLGVLWFGHPGPGLMVNRHARAAGPLAKDGRLFIQGENVVMAYDTYNGVKLWQREIPGAMRTNASHDGSNLALSDRALYVAVGSQCLALDPATGRTTATYPLPDSPDGASRRWGWIACTDQTLFGSAGVAPTRSEFVFAIDPSTGQSRILYQGRGIPHNSLALAGGRLFLIDSGVTEAERQVAIEAERQRIASLPEAQRAEARRTAAPPDVRAVVALDAHSGQVLWRRPVDLSHCGGANLAAMVHRGVMLVFGVYLDGHYWQQFFAGEFATRRVTALSTEDGHVLWSRPVGYRVRPLVIGTTLHAEPWAFDLRTGEPVTRIHPVTGETVRWQFARPGHHCGLPIGSPNCLFFRSLCFGYYDLAGDSGTMHFGAQRPGCWINFIPAGGLLLMPEASVGCMCAFPNMCSVAFAPRRQNKAFAYYSTPGPMTPVERLAVNLGAPGDRRDHRGNLWFGFPRPQGSLVLQFSLDTGFYPGGGFTTRNSTYTPIAGTDDPWLYASAARGLRKCVIPLREPGDGAALYTVRLAFCDPDHQEPGQRLFDVKLQGQLVLAGLDIAAQSGGRDRALLREFRDVAVQDNLVLEFVSQAANPSADQVPLLCGVEVICQQVTSLGCEPPDLLLSSLEPEKRGTLRLANLRPEPFAGQLKIATPDGFSVTPAQRQLDLPSRERRDVPLVVRVAEGTAPGKYPLEVKILRPDGSVELRQTATLEHLGPRGRVVLHPIEDASVQKRYPTRNRGTVDVLLVDGGSQTMNDADHAVGLIKFRLDIPGQPLAARLRIYNAGNPSGDSGRICLVTGPWQERTVTYSTRPALGPELARLGRVNEHDVVERTLHVDLAGKQELGVAIDPTSCDGTDYFSRESGNPPELIVDYAP